MREIKAGVGLVFDTFAGKLYFVLILLMWIFVMVFSQVLDPFELQKTFPIFWLWMYWPFSTGSSQLAAGYKSVLSCGGLYCVPCLTKGMKRFSIIAGFILAFMFTLPLLLAKWPQEWQRYASAAIWFTFFAAGFLGMSIPGPTRNKNILSSMTWTLWVAIFIRIFCAFFLNIHLLDGWPVILAAGIFLCVIYCGPYKDKQIQNAHRQLAASTTDINEDVKQAKMRITPVVEHFFIGRLNKCSQKTKYLWGAIYLCLGNTLANWRRAWVIIPVLSFLVCFIPSLLLPGRPIIIYIVFVLWAATLIIKQKITLPVHAQMLVAGGRRERYYGTIVAVIGNSINIGLWLMLISLLSQLIVLFIPSFVFEDHTIILTPMMMNPILVAMGIIPAYFGLALCYERAPFITDLLIILFTIPAIIFVILMTPMIFKPVPMTLVVISCWVFLILTARTICFEKDLILQADKI